MLNLREYRNKPAALADYLPWACLVAPGIVLNKDGSFQRTIRYRGPDLDSATEAELVSVSARLNNILRRFGTGWALFFEAERMPARSYPGARFADAAAWLVDQERRAAFEAAGTHHESRYHLTFLYLPPPERAQRAERLFYQRETRPSVEAGAFAHLAWFETETERALEMLSTILPEAEALDDAETLAFLHGTISGHRHPITVPSPPTYLDCLLSDTPLLGGIDPKLGDQHLRLLTVLGFPSTTTPGLLDALNDLGFPYRWSTRWIALDKAEANRHLTKLRRHWFAKRKSLGAVLREVMFNRETALVDPDAEARALDADAALQELGSDFNLAHMMPVSAVWAGPDRNRHLNAPPLMLTATRGNTPFRLDLHAGDVGHTLIVGPTGTGKSVLLATLALQFRRFAGAQVAIFDRGRSTRAAALAMAGSSMALGLDGTLALQPLARIDEPGEIAFALDWVMGLLVAEGVTLTPEIKAAVWTGLQSLASAPVTERTLTGLAVLVQSNTILTALTPYTLDGAYGRLLDGAEEQLALADVVHIEMEALLPHKALVGPVLTYLFHRLEARFDGRPTLLILDEAWTFLDEPLFAARIREWLKTLRKKNVVVVFATQSLADIEQSSIAPALIESCPTRIFLPNERALEPQARAVYARFGLNDRQTQILSVAQPKRDYYVQTARGNRLFELGLGPVTLALAAAGAPDDHRLIDRCVAEAQPGAFAEQFLRAKGLPWAADALAAFTEVPRLVRPPPLPASAHDADQGSAPSALPASEPTSPPPQPSLTLETPMAERLSPYHAPAKTSRATRRHVANGVASSLALAVTLWVTSPGPAQALTVFDPLNYQQNVLSALRALEQINTQVRQLEAQAQMILRMEQNLQRLGTTLAPDLQRALADIQSRLRDGAGLALTLRATEIHYAQLYPKEVATLLANDDVLRTAKRRSDEAYASLRRSALLQGQVADGVATDTRLLDDALARSRGAAGALDVAQAGNELAGLHVKQALQLQSLLVAQGRADTLQRARELSLEAEAQQRFRTFVGTGNGYARAP